MNAELFLPLLIGAAALLFGWAIVGLLQAVLPSSRMKSRVAVMQTEEAARESLGLPGRILAFLGSKLGPRNKQVVGEYRLRLSRAGYTAKWAPGAFWGSRILLAMAGGVGGYMITYVAPDKVPHNYSIFLTFLTAYAAFLIPMVWLSYKTRARKKKLMHELPDALDLMVVCVESGMGLDQTLARVAKDTRVACPTLSQELHQVGLELLAGKSRAAVLRDLAKRAGVDELESLVTLVIQSESLGSSIARTFRVYSDTLRTKRFQTAEEIAGKLPVKLLLPLIFFIMPILFVIMVGPASIRVMGIFAQ